MFGKAKRLAYQLKVDLGNKIGIKKSSAKITEVYKSEDLIGKEVLISPRQITDFMSD